MLYIQYITTHTCMLLFYEIERIQAECGGTSLNPSTLKQGRRIVDLRPAVRGVRLCLRERRMLESKVLTVCSKTH